MNLQRKLFQRERSLLQILSYVGTTVYLKHILLNTANLSIDVNEINVTVVITLYFTLMKAQLKVKSNNQTTVQQQQTYIQVIPVTISNGSKSIQINALLDRGLDSTLIRKDLAEKLNLTGSKPCIEIYSVLSNSSKFNSKIVEFKIS